MIVLPLTSRPLKSSQLNSGACTPYPTKTTSESLTAIVSVTRWLNAITSSWGFSVSDWPPFLNTSGD